MRYWNRLEPPAREIVSAKAHAVIRSNVRTCRLAKIPGSPFPSP
jgi:hypothetical protein